MNTTIASPAKLRNGSWGARVQGAATVGQKITIRTRAGKEWDAEVTQIVWTGDNVTIVATRSLDSRPSSRRSARSRGDGNCPRCCYIPGRRTAQIWEDCEYCGAEPVYM